MFEILKVVCTQSKSHRIFVIDDSCFNVLMLIHFYQRKFSV